MRIVWVAWVAYTLYGELLAMQHQRSQEFTKFERYNKKPDAKLCETANPNIRKCVQFSVAESVMFPSSLKSIPRAGQEIYNLIIIIISRLQCTLCVWLNHLHGGCGWKTLCVRTDCVRAKLNSFRIFFSSSKVEEYIWMGWAGVILI